MKEVIMVEILGLVGIVSVFSIWNISCEQYGISIIFLIAMIGADMLLRSESKVVICVIKNILFNEEIEYELNNRGLIEIRRLGLFIILSGLVGIASILILNNWVFIGIEILGNGIGITCAIILNSLIIQVMIIFPIMLKVKSKKIQKDRLKKRNRYNSYMPLNKIK